MRHLMEIGLLGLISSGLYQHSHDYWRKTCPSPPQLMLTRLHSITEAPNRHQQCMSPECHRTDTAASDFNGTSGRQKTPQATRNPQARTQRTPHIGDRQKSEEQYASKNDRMSWMARGSARISMAVDAGVGSQWTSSCEWVAGVVTPGRCTRLARRSSGLCRRPAKAHRATDRRRDRVGSARGACAGAALQQVAT